jgi:phosphodiesterase/alkaline phosphatase D-like protein
MTNAPNRLTSLLHRLGVSGPARPARVRAFRGTGALKASQGTGAPSRRHALVTLAALATTLGALAFTAAPALAIAPTVTSEFTSPAAKPYEEVNFEAAVNPNNGEPSSEVTTCEFQYGETVAYGHEVVCTNPEGNTSGTEQRASATVTGLKPGTTYHWRVVLKNASGKAVGNPEEVTTLPLEKPAIESESVSGATSSAATLQAQVNPEYQETTCVFQYGTDASLTTHTTVPCPASLGEGGGGVGTSVALTGLTAGETYYYRVVAKNATGTEDGTIQSFASVPIPATETPNPIGVTTATFNGKLTPLSETFATKYYFEYNLGSSCSGGIRTTEKEEEAGKGTGAAQETEPVTELEPNAAYVVCLAANNSFGSETSAPVPFTTEPAPPGIASEMAFRAPVEALVEGLAAQVNPNNEETTCSFEYATSEAAIGTPGVATAPCEQASLGKGFGAQLASAHVENLIAGDIYYYRVVATNAAGPSDGTIEHFSTPTVLTEAAQNPTRTSIVLDGTVNPNGVATSYHFAYIDEAGYQAALAGDAQEKANPYADGASTTPQRACPEAELIANPATCDDEGTTPVAVEVPVKGLLPSTTYHYALVASTETGTTIIGNDATFTTAAATPPLVTTGGVSEVTLSTATIAGTVSTQGLDVGYAFEVSTEPGNLGQPAGSGTIGAGAGEAGVSLALQGLQPGTTYYYRLLATSTDGTEYGAILSFTTPGFGAGGILIQPVTPLQVGTPNIPFPTGSQANTQSPSIEVVSHKVKGNTATLEVSVPSAGKLVATGKGVSKGAGKSTKAGDVTVKVTLTKAEAAFLGKHKGRKLKVGVKLVFTQASGGELTGSVTVLIG